MSEYFATASDGRVNVASRTHSGGRGRHSPRRVIRDVFGTAPSTLRHRAMRHLGVRSALTLLRGTSMPADIRPSPVRRVVLVVLDGLRPDAIAKFQLQRVASLARRGASTFRAQTVNPSITPCAMATLLTGAAPERHGIQSEHFHIPRPRGPVHPV